MTTTGTATAWQVWDADWNHWPDGLGDDATWVTDASQGFTGIELGVYDPAVELAPERLGHLSGLAAAHAVPVAMLLLSLTEARWPGGALSGDVERLCTLARATAEIAATLGHRTLGVWPGADPAGAEIRPGLAALAAAVAPTGVRLALEPKPDTAVATVATTLALLDDVPDVGILLDTGHAFAAGEDVPTAIAAAGDRLWHVHLGDAHPGGGDDDLPVGDVHDFAAVVAALDTVGYAGGATLDLYGAVESGAVTGAEAGRRSLAHLAAAGHRR